MINETKIKGFYQRGQNSDEYYQLGTDDKLVDMKSGFTLEEQLKLDLPSYVNVEQIVIEGAPYTSITQKYQDSNNDIIYTIITMLRTTSSAINIIKRLYSGDTTSSSALIKTNSTIINL